jgi:membrane protein YdbS with pleckstrin-like domain
MSKEDLMIHQANFSPMIRRYILVMPALLMCITIVGIPFAIIWFLGIGQLVSKRYYEALECRLTNKHLKYKKGVLVKVEKTIPLENIQDLTFVEGPILKAFNLSILKIETAGNSGSASADMQLIGVEGALEFRNLVMNQRETMRAGGADGEESTQKILSDIRDILRRMESKSDQ